MGENYDETTAGHYAAYRPPLHREILERALAGRDSSFPVGLDVGCGTGRSSVALADRCEQVFAIDPSQAMLDLATTHPAITYRQGEGEEIPLPDRSVNFVTLAGSLFYADQLKTATEVHRVCDRQAFIMPYDFTVRIDDALHRLGIAETETNTEYDPTVNFSNCDQFEELASVRDQLEFDVGAGDLAHLLLSDRALHDQFVDRYGQTAPHARLRWELQSWESAPSLRADIFYTIYRPVES